MCFLNSETQIMTSETEFHRGGPSVICLALGTFIWQGTHFPARINSQRLAFPVNRETGFGGQEGSKFHYSNLGDWDLIDRNIASSKTVLGLAFWATHANLHG